jgi:hypothetical protein
MGMTARDLGTFMRPNEVTKYSWGAPERSDKVLLGCARTK